MGTLYNTINDAINKIGCIYPTFGKSLYEEPRARLLCSIVNIVHDETTSLNDQIHSLESENARLKALLGKETASDQSEGDNSAMTCADSSVDDFMIRYRLKATSCADCGGCGAHYVSRHGYRLCWDCMIKEGEFHIVDGIKMRSMDKICTCRIDADEPARDCTVHHGA